MKYTKEQLMGMSDFKVNVALELLLNPKAQYVGTHYVETGDGVYNNVVKYPEWPNYRECANYCRDWDEVMPLAVEYKLAIMPVYLNECTVWQVTSSAAGKSWRDPKMQRAISCCLILVLQEGRNQNENPA